MNIPLKEFCMMPVSVEVCDSPNQERTKHDHINTCLYTLLPEDNIRKITCKVYLYIKYLQKI